MDRALGVIYLILFAAGVIGLASGVTWLVVKISPAEKDERPEAPAEA